jgi:hypothetical protein
MSASLLQERVKGSWFEIWLARHVAVFCMLAPAVQLVVRNVTGRGEDSCRIVQFVRGRSNKMAPATSTCSALRLDSCVWCFVDGGSCFVRMQESTAIWTVQAGRLLSGQLATDRITDRADKSVRELLSYLEARRTGEWKRQDVARCSAVAKAASWPKIW